MSDSFSLPLRPIKQKTEKPDTLPTRIAQINAQRGSFRDVTEQGLLEEIEAARTSGGGEVPGISDIKTGDNEAPDREKELFNSRAEMMEFAMQAHAESTYALDFVSLALSKYAPRQAEMSMSQYLKFKAPQGSLGIDRIQTPELSDAQRKDDKIISRGWNMESFDSAANKLLEAATRLEEEVATETKYWSEVLAVKEKGWNLCRLPRERQTLGVQFGFLEAAPVFRDRGLAALRRKEDGSLILDSRAQVSQPQTVRIRVQENNRTVGLSVPVNATAHDSNPLETHIHQARDTLFEEELFYELNREARILLRHGVQTRRNQILFSVNDTQQILIDLVGADEAVFDSDLAPGSSSANELSGAISSSLRILLTHAHRKNYRRRTQIPPALTAKKRPTPEYLILRPMINYLQHRSHFQWLTSFIDGITNVLKSAGLECTYSAAPLSSMKRPIPQAAQNANIPLVETLVDKFLWPQESYITGTFLSPACGYTIRIKTDLSPSAPGIEFEVSTNLTCFPRQKTPLRFGGRDDIREFLVYLFTLDVVHAIPSLGGTKPNPALNLPDKPDQQQMPEFDMCDSEEDPVPKSTEPNVPIWELTFPERGELTAFSATGQRTKKLRIEIDSEKLLVRCFRLEPTEDGKEFDPSEDDDKKKKVSKKDYTWRPEPGPDDSRETLEEALRTMEAQGYQEKKDP